MRHRGWAAAGAIAAALWLLAAVGGIIWWMAGDGRLMAREMERHAPPETTGLHAAEYAGVGEMTAGYLTGRAERFQYTFTDAEGNTLLCFQEHEAAHMADCRELILLAGRICLGSLVGLAVIGMALALGTAAERKRPESGRPGAGIRHGAVSVSAPWNRRRERKAAERNSAENGLPGAEERVNSAGAGGRRRAFGRGMLRGFAALAAAGAALGIWAVADFDGFFTAFHRIAFDNEGWLLNPRTDLLIRLMPTDFFIALGLQGVVRFVPAAVIGTGAGLLCAR